MLDPIRLHPTNFTPLSRTPWAGSDIARLYKSRFAPFGTKIGESWEFSPCAEFPSMVGDTSLGKLAELYPMEILGSERPMELLVKILNADSPLSLQVHPTDNDPNLGPNECGKPEAWYVLDAKEGSGVYLGFNRSMSKGELSSLIKSRAPLNQYLGFVPVKKGEFFEIAPGVCHAVGPGLTLLEPQRVLPGRAGKTYRLWDWNRRYNKSGEESPDGDFRELHVEAGLEAMPHVEEQYGESFLAKLRKIPDNYKRRDFSACIFRSSYFRLVKLEVSPGARLSFAHPGTYSSCLIFRGDGSMRGKGETCNFAVGDSFLIPAAAGEITLMAGTNGAELTIVLENDRPFTLG